MGIRTTANRTFSYSANQDQRALQLIGYGTTTGAGAAGGTTLVDADGVADSAAANTYNALYWVQIRSGALIGEWARVVDDDGAGTLTLEGNGFRAQVASGVEYALYYSSEPAVNVDSSSGATDMVDATRDEADDYWIGYYATPLSGNRAGELAQVTDSTSSSGTFVLGSGLSGALAAGDSVLLRRFVEAGNVSMTPAEPLNERIGVRANFSEQDGVLGPRSGTISFDVEAVASGSQSSLVDGDYAPRSILCGLMQACGFIEYRSQVLTVDDAGAANTTTVFTVDTGTHERVRIGQPIMHQGNVTFVISKTDGGGSADTITCYPPLPTTPNDNDLLYPCNSYEPDTDATQLGITIYYEMDGVTHTFFDCKGNVEVLVADTSALLFRFTLSYDHWVRQQKDEQAQPASAYSTAKIIRGIDRVVHMSATDQSATEQLDIKGITMTPGIATTPIDVSGKLGLNGTSGHQITAMKRGATFQTLIEDSGESDLAADILYQARTAKDWGFVFGSHGNCIAVRMPKARLIESPTPTDDGGKQSTPYVLRAHDSGVVSDPASGTHKLADFAIHIF